MSCCGGCDDGIGDLLPRIVWPSDVDREKSRLHPSFVATDLAVKQCPLDPATHSGWNAFYAEWHTFKNRETPTFGAANEWDATQRYAVDLEGWRSVLREKCELAGPDVKPTDTGDLGWVKWVAGAAAAVGIAYTVGPLLRSFGTRR